MFTYSIEVITFYLFRKHPCDKVVGPGGKKKKKGDQLSLFYETLM